MKLVIFSICLWEVVALATSGKYIPTITKVVHIHRDNWWVVLIVLLCLGWVIFHLLLEGRR